MAIFKGAGVAIVTPMKDNLEVNYDKLDEMIQIQIDNGTDCIVIAGTTGESSTLTMEEHADVIQAAVQMTKHRVPVVAGTGSNCTKTAIQLTQEAQEAGCDGALIVTPYYNKATQAGLSSHYGQIAQSTKLPIILYNVPGRTGVSIAPDTIARLAQVPNIYGMKDASGNMDNLTTLLRTVPEHFKVYTGDDNLAVPALSIGVYGLISVCAQVAPAPIKEMMDAFRAGELEKAAKMHRDLFPLLDVMFIASNPVPTKVALNLMGYDVGGVRLPLTMPSKSQAEKIAAVLKAQGLIETTETPENLYI